MTTVQRGQQPTTPPGQRPPGRRTAVALAGSSTARTVGLGLVLVAVTVAMLRPTPHTVTRTLPDNLGDPALVTALLAWGAHALVSDPSGVLDAPFFWDHPNALAFSDPLLALAPVHGVLSTATGSHVTAVNLLSLGLVVLNLAATFALAKRIVGRSDAALVAAFAAAFNAFTFSNISHIQLQTVGFLPLGFLALFVLFERERTLDGLWLAAATIAITLSALYYGVLWSVVLGLVVVAEVVRRRGRLSRSLWAGLALAGVVIAVVLGPLGLVYRSTSAEHGGDRGYQLDNVLQPRDLLTPARDNWLWGTSLDRFGSIGVPGPHGFFMGLTVYVLGIVGLVVLGVHLVRRFRRPPTTGTSSLVATTGGRPPGAIRWRELVYLTAAGGLAGALALGPSPAGRPGMFRLFYHLVPGFDGIRVTSRLAVVAILAGAVLVAVGYAALVRRLPERPELRLAAVVVVGGLVLAEAYGSGQVRAEVPRGPARTAAYDELASRPPGPVLELPMADPGQGAVWPYTEAPRMLLGIADRNPRVNGYSGFFPTTYLGDVVVLNRFPADEAIDRLDELGVRYVLLHLVGDHGYPALSDADVDAIRRGLPAGATSERHGDAWLVDLGDPG
jgi:hypothetical protein